ncbi:hypothetical protein BJ978_001781 [Agromyces terreus]|uniref:Uncharacterized protein n=1 Tax=Agromyces terreus TaxID=424795 RepID=A0A9X2H1U2_9MICO|nr:hypothetical protein [Agromyces terreus]MCP2371105.1 hypothetical protein [Agromyces terreus]
MSDQEKFEAFVSAVGKLPPTSGVTFHGGNETVDPGTLVGVLATSRSILVATENLRSTTLIVVLGRTGRELSALSGHPDEREVVFLPGTTFGRVIEGEAPGGLRIVILEELGEHIEPGGHGTPRDLLESVVAHVARERTLPPVVVHSPGKFVGPLPLLGSAAASGGAPTSDGPVAPIGDV